MILLDLLLVFGPILGYIPQYLEIWKTRNHRAFSKKVSMILLVANILRLGYWWYEKFEDTLVWQAFVMIGAQLLMLELILRIKSMAEMKSFWRMMGWLIGSLLLLIASLSTFIALDLRIFRLEYSGQILGFAALSVESTLAMPQAYRNWKHKCTSGLRPELIFSWALGDAFKTGYFIIRRAPWVFLMCGIVQLLVDGLIFVQMWLYSENPDKIEDSSSSSV